MRSESWGLVPRIAHPNFDDSADWRAISETALTASISSRLALKLGHELRYEHQPVAAESTDSTTRASLVVSF
jgi:putative salt-induced outer membrane protein YdiY